MIITKAIGTNNFKRAFWKKHDIGGATGMVDDAGMFEPVSVGAGIARCDGAGEGEAAETSLSRTVATREHGKKGRGARSGDGSNNDRNGGNGDRDGGDDDCDGSDDDRAGGNGDGVSGDGGREGGDLIGNAREIAGGEMSKDRSRSSSSSLRSSSSQRRFSVFLAGGGTVGEGIPAGGSGDVEQCVSGIRVEMIGSVCILIELVAGLLRFCWR
jgi:hypothetical protein